MVPGGTCPQAPGESLDHWYLRCDLPGAAAGSADIVVVQDQVNTTNPAEFSYLYNSSLSQARAANPQVVVDAEVSTNYGTAGQMVTAAKSIAAGGFYLNATTSTLRKAKSFLYNMQVAGY